MTEPAPEESPRHGHGGGVAAAGGMDFQHRVAAWLAVRILAEADASPLWDWRTAGDSLRCETTHPVDDILLEDPVSGRAFIQSKRSLTLSADGDSEFGSAIDQFVRQFHQAGGSNRDRLVLAVGPTSSAPIRTHLPGMLERLRGLRPNQTVAEASTNAEEERALAAIRGHVESAWQRAKGAAPSEVEVRELLATVRVQPADVENGGADEREARNLLRAAILRDPNQADAAWGCLVSFCARLAAGRSGADRSQLQDELIRAGFDLQAPRSFRADIERLREHSAFVLGLLADLARIRIRGREVKIQRESTFELTRVIGDASLLVVGEPGAGKSGALHDLVQGLDAGGADVVFLAADRIEARSLGQLRAELGLDHELASVLARWPGARPAFLVIDALDAARAEPAARALRDLMESVEGAAGRWRVVSSIRKFDLRYSAELRRAFDGTPPTAFVDPEFDELRHLNVPTLSDAELRQVAEQAPELQQLVDAAPAELQELLRVPFNLRLLAEMLDGGAAVAQLTPVRTQLELLDRYWVERVITGDGLGDAREAVLRRACQGMVDQRLLRIERSSIAEPTTAQALRELLSAQILAEWQPAPGAQPDRYLLAFSHHVLFDYAVARLLLRIPADRLVQRLEDDVDLLLAIRPSLTLHFHHLWLGDRAQFWDLTMRMMRSARIPEIGKLLGPSVAGDLAAEPDDLDPLYDSLQ